MPREGHPAVSAALVNALRDRSIFLVKCDDGGEADPAPRHAHARHKPSFAVVRRAYFVCVPDVWERARARCAEALTFCPPVPQVALNAEAVAQASKRKDVHFSAVPRPRVASPWSGKALWVWVAFLHFKPFLHRYVLCRTSGKQVVWIKLREVVV